MRARDLMLGDYISVKPSGMPIKVAAVHHKKVAYHAIISKLTWVRESLLEPIPLTPEILEKNGFEKSLQLSDTEPFATDEEGNKHYSYNKTFWGWWQTNNIFCIPANGLGWLNIKYAHQLQHALRLCGIIREIII